MCGVVDVDHCSLCSVLSVVLLMLVIRMDIVRWSEYISIQWILFAVNALVHVSTTYPDATGYQQSCRDPDKHVAGAWMWHYVTTASDTPHHYTHHSTPTTTHPRPYSDPSLASCGCMRCVQLLRGHDVERAHAGGRPRSHGKCGAVLSRLRLTSAAAVLCCALRLCATSQTLIPLIMIRRLMWDWLGWNLTSAVHHTRPLPSSSSPCLTSVPPPCACYAEGGASRGSGEAPVWTHPHTNTQTSPPQQTLHCTALYHPPFH